MERRAGLARKKTGLSVACKRYLLILRDEMIDRCCELLVLRQVLGSNSRV